MPINMYFILFFQYNIFKATEIKKKVSEKSNYPGEQSKINLFTLSSDTVFNHHKQFSTFCTKKNTSSPSICLPTRENLLFPNHEFTKCNHLFNVVNYSFSNCQIHESDILNDTQQFQRNSFGIPKDTKFQHPENFSTHEWPSGSKTTQKYPNNMWVDPFYQKTPSLLDKLSVQSKLCAEKKIDNRCYFRRDNENQIQSFDQHSQAKRKHINNYEAAIARSSMSSSHGQSSCFLNIQPLPKKMEYSHSNCVSESIPIRIQNYNPHQQNYYGNDSKGFFDFGTNQVAKQLKILHLNSKLQNERLTYQEPDKNFIISSIKENGAKSFTDNSTTHRISEKKKEKKSQNEDVCINKPIKNMNKYHRDFKFFDKIKRNQLNENTKNLKKYWLQKYFSEIDAVVSSEPSIGNPENIVFNESLYFDQTPTEQQNLSDQQKINSRLNHKKSASGLNGITVDEHVPQTIIYQNLSSDNSQMKFLKNDSEYHLSSDPDSIFFEKNFLHPNKTNMSVQNKIEILKNDLKLIIENQTKVKNISDNISEMREISNDEQDSSLSFESVDSGFTNLDDDEFVIQIDQFEQNLIHLSDRKRVIAKHNSTTIYDHILFSLEKQIKSMIHVYDITNKMADFLLLNQKSLPVEIKELHNIVLHRIIHNTNIEMPCFKEIHFQKSYKNAMHMKRNFKKLKVCREKTLASEKIRCLLENERYVQLIVNSTKNDHPIMKMSTKLLNLITLKKSKQVIDKKDDAVQRNEMYYYQLPKNYKYYLLFAQNDELKSDPDQKPFCTSNKIDHLEKQITELSNDVKSKKGIINNDVEDKTTKQIDEKLLNSKNPAVEKIDDIQLKNTKKIINPKFANELVRKINSIIVDYHKHAELNYDDLQQYRKSYISVRNMIEGCQDVLEEALLTWIDYYKRIYKQNLKHAEFFQNAISFLRTKKQSRRIH